MNLPITVTQDDLLEILLNVAPSRPVFIWGAPGIGKSALVNRMFHVQMRADARQWIKWAQKNNLHPGVIDYIIQRPDHLFSEPLKTEEPFSTPRSWHMLSDALCEYEAGKQDISGNMLSFVYRAKGMLKKLATINFEIAQMVVASDDENSLPDWFRIEVIRDLPRLVNHK